MSLIVKTVPDSCHNTFSIRFTSCFFNATQNEILNSSKFRFPFKAKEVQQYLDADITFVATMFKQRFIDPQIVKQ